MLSQHSLLWILTSAILSMKTNYFTVCSCKAFPSFVCFSDFAFRRLKISIIEFFFSQPEHRPVPEIRPNILTKAILNLRNRTPTYTNIWLLKPLCYSSFHFWATLFLLRLTHCSGNSVTQPTLLTVSLSYLSWAWPYSDLLDIPF